MYDSQPGITIIWAHAGLYTPPQDIARMFERYPSLHADLSLRDKDILIKNGRRLAPGWKQLFRDFPDRLMVGSDAYLRSHWADYEGIIQGHRRWLEMLPQDTAQAIANGNARRVLDFYDHPAD